MRHLHGPALIAAWLLVACSLGPESPEAKARDEAAEVRVRAVFAASRAASAPLVIEAGRLDHRGLLLHLRGRDPGAPRGVWLWRLRGSEAAVVARTESRADGEIAFPALAVPAAGLELVATPAGEGRDATSRSAPLRVDARIPEPPRAEVVGATPDEVLVEVDPAAGGGGGLVADADGRELARFPVPPAPDRSRRALALAVPRAGGGPRVLLAHEDDDGRRSAWRPLGLDAPTSREGEGEDEQGEDEEGEAEAEW